MTADAEEKEELRPEPHKTSSHAGSNLGTVHEYALAGQPVPPGSACFLVVALDALGERRVHDESHVGFVDPHAVGDGGADYLQAAGRPGALHHAALVVGHARMIVVRVYPRPL